MRKQQAFTFWSTYAAMIMKNGATVTMTNPAIDFTARAKAGDYDCLSDEEYMEELDDAEQTASFWRKRKEAAVGSIFLEALKQTSLDHQELEELSEILAEASTRVTYKYQEPKKKSKRQAEEDTGFEHVYETTPFDTQPFLWTPRKIYEYLSESVYGQEQAKRSAATLLYQHMQGHRRNMLMAGPSGCGKTEIWRTLQRKFSCIKIINGPQLSCDGWKGSYHLKDIFLEAPEEEAQHLIIVVDEADKLFEPAVTSGGTDFARMIQNEFLKVMDGDEITFVDSDRKEPKALTVDCTNISFVFCGSFETLQKNKAFVPMPIGFSGSRGEELKKAEGPEVTEEDLISYGNIRREIAGRIDSIVLLNALKADDFEYIMESRERMSPIRQLERVYGIEMALDAKTRRALAVKAAESQLGCRYIRSRLQNMLDNQMFDEPDRKKFELSM